MELFREDMNASFDTISDTMPVDRTKFIHSRGVHAKVEWIATPDSPYTGLFKGCKHGILRISELVQTTPEVPKTAPGQALKCLRDGMSSGNWFAMYAFDGQPSFNFFKNRWTNILREMENECSRHTIGKRMAEVTDHIGATSLLEFSEFDEFGNWTEPHWPF